MNDGSRFYRKFFRKSWIHSCIILPHPSGSRNVSAPSSMGPHGCGHYCEMQHLLCTWLKSCRYMIPYPIPPHRRITIMCLGTIHWKLSRICLCIRHVIYGANKNGEITMHSGKVLLKRSLYRTILRTVQEVTEKHTELHVSLITRIHSSQICPSMLKSL